MSFVLLGAAILLLAYAIAVVLGTAIVFPLFLCAARISEPALRARRLLCWRLFPSAFGLLSVFGLVLPAFLWLEPRDTSETVSASMAALAGVGLLMLVAGSARGLLSIRATNLLLKRWNRGAMSIEVPGVALPVSVVNDPFPIVSLVGWFRPRLVVARTVLESCDGKELAAVLAHEAGHHSRRDPWGRLLVRACPDLLSMTLMADRIERVWAEAAEQDADERAARTGPTRALDLASALVKVARLAGARRAPATAVSALYRGEGVAVRVARLLERGSWKKLENERRPRSVLVIPAVLALLVLASASGAYGLRHQVYGATEALVSLFQ